MNKHYCGECIKFSYVNDECFSYARWRRLPHVEIKPWDEACIDFQARVTAEYNLKYGNMLHYILRLREQVQILNLSLILRHGNVIEVNVDKELRITVNGRIMPQDMTLRDIYDTYLSNLRIYDDPENR